MAVSVCGPGDSSNNPIRQEGGATAGGGPGRVQAAGHDGRGDASGMAESVTRHAHVTEGVRDWRYLACGFDTVDLGLYVNWGRDWGELFNRLQIQKQDAQGQNSVLWRECDLGPCLVHAGGKAPNYRFHLQLPEYHLYLAAQQQAERMPNVYVSPSSRILWTRGLSAVVEEIGRFIGELGGCVDRFQISRVDLAADFLIPGGIPLDYMRSTLVPSDRKTTHYCDGQALETFYVGSKSGAAQARIYDKSKEILKSLKLWFIPIWQVDECKDIWRVEFQVRRAMLKQFGIDTPADLLAHASALWRHLSGTWMTLRLPDDSNTSRRTPCLWWQAVAGLENLIGPLSDRQRLSAEAAGVPVEWFVSHMSGCLVSFAARQGIGHLEDAMLALVMAMRAYWSTRDWATAYDKKSITLGVLADGQVEDVAHVPF